MRNLFWDTCVFTAHLSEQTGCDLDSISQIIKDARMGKVKIYTSSIAGAEILPSHLAGKSYKSFERFLKDMEGAVIPIAPDQNIMSIASRLRDIPYSKRVNNIEIVQRSMDVPDAIMLATALVAGSGYRVKLDEFQTYDNGAKRSVDGGKRVPILTYEAWCLLLPDAHKRTAQKVIDLKRRPPVHSDPELPHV